MILAIDTHLPEPGDTWTVKDSQDRLIGLIWLELSSLPGGEPVQAWKWRVPDRRAGVCFTFGSAILEVKAFAGYTRASIHLDTAYRFGEQVKVEDRR